MIPNDRENVDFTTTATQLIRQVRSAFSDDFITSNYNKVMSWLFKKLVSWVKSKLWQREIEISIVGL